MVSCFLWQPRFHECICLFCSPAYSKLVAGQARSFTQCQVLLPAATTTPHPTFARRRLHRHTGALRLSPAASTTVVLCRSTGWCPEEDDRQAATRPQRSCASRIEPRQVRPRTDPIPAPHSTLARRRRPDPVQAVRPSVQISASHGSRISGRALQTCLRHRRSTASEICWPFRESDCQHTEDARSVMPDLQLGTLFLTLKKQCTFSVYFQTPA